jgi:XTP/dITP diphosphohydrolase
MATLILATGNQHKAGEIRSILGDGFQYLTLKDFPDAPKTVEDADTFAGNATKKASELAEWLARRSLDERGSLLTGTGTNFVLADDSGLGVDALNGAPGVHSARFAALDSGAPGNSSDADNNAKLLRLLADVPSEEHTARFHCVIALAPVPDPHPSPEPRMLSGLTPRLFEGICPGRILFEPSGRGGFGYDPLFVPDGFERTFAELGDEVKNRISHRARALTRLKAAF